MAIEDDDKPRKKTAEIARLTSAQTMKRATRDAADRFFKTS
jgi:uncharacterized small protein (DUF1192 family)